MRHPAFSVSFGCAARRRFAALAVLFFFGICLPWAAQAQATAADAYQAAPMPGGPFLMDEARWLDFAPLDLAQVQSTAGQDFEFAVTSASGVQATLSLNLLRPAMLVALPDTAGTLRTSALPVNPAVAPDFHRGSALGEVLYAPYVSTRQPALVSEHGTATLNLSELALRNAAGHQLQFHLVAADAGETVPLSSTESEGLSFVTNGEAWDASAAVQITPVWGNQPATVQHSMMGDTVGLSSRLVSFADPNLPLAEADYRASAWVFPTLNPTEVHASLYTQSGNNQAVAFAVIPLIPEAYVQCAPWILEAGASATCTISVTNPPQSAYTLSLVLNGDADRFTGCTSVSFAPLQESATCTLTPTPGPDAGVQVQVGVDAGAPGWLTPGPLTQVATRAFSGSTASVKPVPADAPWALGLLVIALGLLGGRRALHSDRKR
ncbi:hypothetical protein E9531_14860 [Lampropedia puyangensis]|uniref:Surface adhesin CshA non-repetitive domain-containing protein n=1 Tax=Lampropedia puyangensis TaxID=1330072 RepID=A0A4S8EZ55_9BURK|nr:CshA/CshB family fibrillar adhesin-related protein [Lampropedia puyangensis]THT98081.1 hypothetical protein E9531_14860 [Lampropedia puyangensis]